MTEEEIYQTKLQYLKYLADADVDLSAGLVEYLDRVDYWHKPASAQYFNAFPGGLCKYAVDLCYELGQLANAYFPGKYTKADIVKIALLKDIYKAELFEAYNKNVKDETTGAWNSVMAYKYKENRPTFGDLGFSSYMIAKNFVSFTDEQIEAITQSGTKDCYAGDIHEIYRSYPLVTLTKMADFATMYLD